MRRSKLDRRGIAASLGLAGCAALAGAQMVRGDFIASMYSQLGVAYGGGSYDVFVFTTTNDGNHTGTGLLGEETVIDSGGPSTFNSPTGALAIDVEKVSGSGANTKYYANVDGNATMSHGVDPGGKSVYGDPASGTFVGVGWDGAALEDAAYYNPDYTDNPVYSTGESQNLVFVQGNTSTYPHAAPPKANFTGTAAQLDPAFTNSGGTITVGNINNGTVHSLDVVSFTQTGVKNPALTPDFGVVPFAQVVVAPGTTFTVSSQFAGSSFAAAYRTVVTAGSPAPGPAIALSSSPGAANFIGTVSLSASAAAPQNIVVDGPARTSGSLIVNGSNPTHAYGLQVIGAKSTAQFISDLNNAMQSSNPGAIVEAPTGAVANALTFFGDNVEVVLPSLNVSQTSATLGGFNINPTSANSSPTYFSYDLSAYTGNGTVAITQITVLPEPAGFGMILAGGAALSGKRRKRNTPARSPMLPNSTFVP